MGLIWGSIWGRILAALAAFSIVWAAWSSWQLSGVQRDLEVTQRALQAERLQASANASAMAKKGSATAKANTEQEQRLETSHKALEKHPEWANQPVPSDVLDSLRH